MLAYPIKTNMLAPNGHKVRIYLPAEWRNGNKPRQMLAQQFLRFTGVGAIGTTGHYITLVFLVEVLGIDAVYASFSGFVVGALINYHLNRSYTFKSDVSHSVALPKFFTIAAIGAILNTGIMAVMVNHLTLHYFLAQVLATGAVLVWGFLGNRMWTFASTGKENV